MVTAGWVGAPRLWWPLPLSSCQTATPWWRGPQVLDLERPCLSPASLPVSTAFADRAFRPQVPEICSPAPQELSVANISQNVFWGEHRMVISEQQGREGAREKSAAK